MLAPAGRAPRQRGTLSALKARLLPGSSETEFSTPFGARKHAGKPVSAAAAYTPPAPATESTLRPATAGEQARAAVRKPPQRPWSSGPSTVCSGCAVPTHRLRRPPPRRTHASP